MTELRARLTETDNLPYGFTRTSAVEEILTEAEALADPLLLFDVHMNLIKVLTFGGDPARAFPPFAAALAAYDRGDTDFHDDGAQALRWRFKWIIAAMPDYPAISREQVEGALADMERRFTAAGQSLYAVHTLAATVHRHLGDRDAAERAFQLWTGSERDGNSDCAACDAANQATHHIWMDRSTAAIRVAAPVLERQLTCLEEPQGILLALLPAYLRKKSYNSARDAHLRAYRMHRDDPLNGEQIGGHIAFCARTGNEARGLEILTRHLAWLDRPREPMAELKLAASAILLLRRLEKTGPAGLTLDRPAYGERPAAKVGVDELRADLERRAREIAAQFDARNSNSYQGEQTEELMAAEPYVDALPLSLSDRINTTAVPYTSDVRAAAQHNDRLWQKLWDDEEELEPESLEAAILAVQLWRRTDDRAARASAELHLGMTYCERAEWLDAAQALEMARYDLEQAGLMSSADAEKVMRLLGRAQAELHEYAGAAATFAEVARIRRAAGDLGMAASLLEKAAEAYADGDNHTEAADVYRQAADCYRTAGYPKQVVAMQRKRVDELSAADLDEESYQLALENRRLADTLAENSDNAWLKASVIFDVAYALWYLDRDDEAIEVAATAAAAYEEGGLWRSLGHTHDFIADAHWRLCRLAEAEKAALAALDAYRTAGISDTADRPRKTLKLLEKIRGAGR